MAQRLSSYKGLLFVIQYNEEVWEQHFTDVEGCVNHFYLDGDGIVTIGRGCVVFNPMILPMIRKTTLLPAEQDEIIAEYKAIKILPSGQTPDYYGKVCRLQLPGDEIDKVFKERRDEAIQAVEKEITPLDSYPVDTAALAIVDMTFNLGIGGLIHKFPRFIVGFKAKDWNVCFRECVRKQRPEYPGGISKTRNDWTQHQFQILETT